MPTPPPLELKLMIKRSQYKTAKSERKKQIIIQKVKRLKREIAIIPLEGDFRIVVQGERP